ncbi:MAG: tRNA uridine-5-carboxymethylaminomethyl(34) synthesis GTPase MnmE [Chlamydiae bacterium]|nr:tRNA uridine-5-carboxymethylaminomethyl(34) synthesis GTPase MnmE [Chlamydiota bacterium]MBI3266221.1 tRNA uridine-5-carboxymethylaminomethyl(34) synthesis GTPase MnmE [Chlamydiota bacterium]
MKNKDVSNIAEDTIVALATPLGEGALAVLRLSGSASLMIADQIFRTSSGKSPSSFEIQRLYLGSVSDEKEALDEGMGCVFKAPKSYTCEDSFEIYLHGSPYLAQRILSLILEKGARLARPGEFTQRAFLNGRLDLSQAEAVIDLIQAKSELQRKYALQQLKGEFSGKLLNLRQKIFDVMVETEANIDFPEYVPQGVSPRDYAQLLKEIRDEIQNLLKGAKTRRILKEGFKGVLMGEPNVGKSSLLNSLAKKELAIVTELPGTTRDAIEYEMNFNGVPLRLVDTAGLREPENIVEKKGIEVTHHQYEEADLILWIFDVSGSPFDLTKVQPWLGNGKDAMLIFNKVDLNKNFSKSEILKTFPRHPFFETSLLLGQGLKTLEEALLKWVKSKNDILECQYLVNARHQEILQAVEKDLRSAQNALENNLGDDLISSDLHSALLKWDELLGTSVNEEMIQTLFSRFCIGK